MLDVTINIPEMAPHDHTPGQFQCVGQLYVRKTKRDRCKLVPCGVDLTGKCHQVTTCWRCGTEYPLGDIGTLAKPKPQFGFRIETTEE